MASTGGGVNGAALAVAAVGGVLVYAGFAGVSPLEALRAISTGKPKPPANKSGGLAADIAAIAQGAASGVTGSSGFGGSALRSAVVAAASKYMGDQYSQPKRTQPGYSDCSSFVDKCLTDGGAKPPVKWASSANYRLSPDWKTIPRSQALPGDIAISTEHMILITAAGGTAAVGQEDYGINVRTGTPEHLFGHQIFWFKTWKGYQQAAPPPGGGGGSW